MAFSNAKNFQIHRSTFNDARGDISYRIQRNNNHHIQGDYNQHINIHEDQDTRSCVHSAMTDHVHMDALHDSGARRDPSRCYPGTREAALKTISDWIGDPATHCLWLHGPAGTGKSAVAQTLAEQCDQDGTLGATYFFTKGSISDSGSPLLFSTLAYQLMSIFPGLDKHLWAAIRADRTIFHRSLGEQLDRLIVQPFLKLADKSATTVVIVDGLDECDGTSIQGEIVRLILDLEQHSLPLKFVISSRSEPEIRRAFESSPPSSLARLRLDKTLHPDRDIRHFLCNEFERIYQQSVEFGMPPVPQLPWPSTEAMKKLVSKCSGHFIYAATVIRFIQEDHAHPMDQLDAILRIPAKSSSSSAAKGIIADSIAFQELDGLYLHILRKYRNRAELAQILRAIQYFGPGRRALRSPDELGIIFGLRRGGVHLMLSGLHSLIDVPAGDGRPRFLHASFRDFLTDPERSQEFHLEISHFHAVLACAYTRLIVKFSPAESGYMLRMAMEQLGGCLEATRTHTGLLPTTLGKFVNIVAQESESTPPCLFHVVLDFLLRKILKGLPEAEAERKQCENLQRQLEPKLVELSDSIFTILRVLGAHRIATKAPISSLPIEEIGPLIGVFNGEEIVQKTLGLDYKDLNPRQAWREPIQQLYESLSHWLLAHYRPKLVKVWRRPTWVAVHQYTWTWAWNVYTSQSFAHTYAVLDELHDVDFFYGCLRTLLLESDSPSNLASPLTQQTLECASRFLNYRTGYNWPYFDLVEIIERTDFTSILQALPDLSTTHYRRLPYLHHALDRLFYRLQADSDADLPLPPNLHRPVPHYQKFLEIIYSRLLQDSFASRAVLVIYATFATLPLRTIAELLGLAPQELDRSAAIQGLLCVDFKAKGDKRFKISKSLGILLKVGRVKMRPSQSNRDGCIDDYMNDAHEYLAFTCAKHLELCSERDVEQHSLRWYARRYWGDHVGYAKPSERLFEILRRVNINSRDIEPVIQWLEESPDVPEDILTRWYAARVNHGLVGRKAASCHLDQVFQSRRSLRVRFRA